MLMAGGLVREHIAWVFNDGDEMFHDLIRTHPALR